MTDPTPAALAREVLELSEGDDHRAFWEHARTAAPALARAVLAMEEALAEYDAALIVEDVELIAITGGETILVLCRALLQQTAALSEAIGNCQHAIHQATQERERAEAAEQRASALAVRVKELEAKVDEQFNSWGDQVVGLDEEMAKCEAREAALAAQLGCLLARIHRDGGHYQSEHGIDRACADADMKVVELIATSEALATRLAASERLERLHSDRADHWRNRCFDKGASMAKDSIDEGFYKTRCLEAERARDEWKQAHDDLVGVRQSDVAALAARLAEVEAALRPLCAHFERSARIAYKERTRFPAHGDEWRRDCETYALAAIDLLAALAQPEGKRHGG